MEYQGKGVYNAVSVGEIYVYKRSDALPEPTKVSDTQKELTRFSDAKDAAKIQLNSIYKKALVDVGQESAQIFDIHIMMIDDEDYNETIENSIKDKNLNAEYAVYSAGEVFSEMFAAMDDSYMQARATDVKDISDRIIRCLRQDEKENDNMPYNAIVCADDLTPSETVSLDKNKVVAFATSYGTSNSHTAILARSMNIPAVIGLGEEFISNIKDGETAVIDGFNGKAVVNPTEEQLEHYEKIISEEKKKRQYFLSLTGKGNVTADGRKIDVFANIGSPDDIKAVKENDAGGIGLFRSEFLYLEKTDYPSEQEQFEKYKYVLLNMAPKKVIIRTLDIGADKTADYFNLKPEENPAMGMRAIRLCLERRNVFITQLRALYRASAYGNLAILFPMIANEFELREIIAICDKVRDDLCREGIEFSRDVELGIMVETPAAALISDKLAPLSDFFSVGTNDLTQYTLACDRQNPYLERYCNTHHEAVMRLIEMTAGNAHANGKWIGICGELAADTTLTERFLRMGIDELSVSPSAVLRVRSAVREINLSSNQKQPQAKF